MKIVNLTPHDLHIHLPSGVRTIAKSGTVARAKQTTSQAGEVDGIPVVVTSFGAVEGLPPAKAGTVYVVSSLVASAAKGRADVLAPGEPVRDAEGRVIGAKNLARVSPARPARKRPGLGQVDRKVPKPVARKIRRAFHRG